MIGTGAIPGVDLLPGDAAAVLAGMAAGSVQCCVTSPPYFQLRRYLEDGHPDGALEIGQEATPREFVAALVAVFGAVRRVLRDDGTLWVNIGDSYGSGEVGRHDSVQGREIDGKRVTSKSTTRQHCNVSTAVRPKSLLLIPHRFAIAMGDDGWICRQDLCWSKPAPMPESVQDRCTRSHEYVFMFTKQPRYYYDAAAIAQPVEHPNRSGTNPSHVGMMTAHARDRRREPDQPINTAGPTRNRRSVWADIPPEPSGAEHYAAYPTRLPELCLLAGSSPTACGGCGSPWRRVVEVEKAPRGDSFGGKKIGDYDHGQAGSPYMATVRSTTTGWAPTCACPPDDTGRCTVLDPFSGSGSTGVAALRNGRRYIGIDLKDEYHDIARRRLTKAHYETAYGVRHERERVADGQLPMFASIVGGGADGD